MIIIWVQLCEGHAAIWNDLCANDEYKIIYQIKYISNRYQSIIKCRRPAKLYKDSCVSWPLCRVNFKENDKNKWKKNADIIFQFENHDYEMQKKNLQKWGLFSSHENDNDFQFCEIEFK